jgi:hypothetical protein
MYSKEQIEKAVKSKGYVWFNGLNEKGYDVNIVGVRNNSPSTFKKVTNVFDDFITLTFKDENGVVQYYCWSATTDPGKKGVQQFHNRKGVARLIPGQYRGVWAIDKHQGKYEALCQRNGNVDVWRDGNKDLIFDEILKDCGMFGINIHKAGQDSMWVENWSEGCQVFKRVKDFDEFMKICKKASKIWGNKFSYTLIESTDIK